MRNSSTVEFLYMEEQTCVCGIRSSDSGGFGQSGDGMRDDCLFLLREWTLHLHCNSFGWVQCGTGSLQLEDVEGGGEVDPAPPPHA